MCSKPYSLVSIPSRSNHERVRRGACFQCDDRSLSPSDVDTMNRTPIQRATIAIDRSSTAQYEVRSDPSSWPRRKPSRKKHPRNSHQTNPKMFVSKNEATHTFNDKNIRKPCNPTRRPLTYCCRPKRKMILLDRDAGPSVSPIAPIRISRLGLLRRLQAESHYF